MAKKNLANVVVDTTTAAWRRRNQFPSQILSALLHFRRKKKKLCGNKHSNKTHSFGGENGFNNRQSFVLTFARFVVNCNRLHPTSIEVRMEALEFQRQLYILEFFSWPAENAFVRDTHEPYRWNKTENAVITCGVTRQLCMSEYEYYIVADWSDWTWRQSLYR